MNENQNNPEPTDTTQPTASTGERPTWEPPHADPTTLRSAYAFDGSGPYLYGPDGSGPYRYSFDGRGPYLVGSAALGGAQQQGWTGAFGTHQPGMHGHGPAGVSASAPSRHTRRHLGLMIGAGVAALALVGGVTGTALGLAMPHTETTSSQGTRTTTPGTGTGTGSGTGTGTGTDGSGTNGFTVPGGGTGSSTGTGTGTGTGTQSTPTAATAAQKKGVVTINTVLNYDQSEQAAGTGMVLTANGTVLTNNHVVQGATSITVTDETTGKEYTADVVGTDATHDVAVLKLQDASGLSTVALDDDGGATTGDAITDVGNAEGTGDLVAATGTVTATDQDITVQSESGSGTESLTGLIQLDADIVSGDSGGPVLDSEGEVVGMATAASSGSADVTGFAIPIATAKSIATKILAGESSDTITIGLPAFLGVEVGTTSTTAGVPLAGVVTGSPAATAGLAAGDTITSIDGTAVTSGDQLTQLIQAHGVGDSVTVGITDATGAASTVTATLTAGPAA